MTDRFTVRAVVVFLGLLGLASLIIGGLLANQEKGVPDFIVATGSGALAALGTLLARTGTESVTIDNQPDNPVPVEPGE